MATVKIHLHDGWGAAMCDKNRFDLKRTETESQVTCQRCRKWIRFSRSERYETRRSM